MIILFSSSYEFSLACNYNTDLNKNKIVAAVIEIVLNNSDSSNIFNCIRVVIFLIVYKILNDKNIIYYL